MAFQKITRLLTATIIFLAIFSFFDQKIKSAIKIPETINPYQRLEDNSFLEEQMGEYGKKVVIPRDGKYYVDRHPSNSPVFFAEIFNHFPPKEKEETRIIFFGNSQLFQVPSGDRIPIPFKTQQLLQEKIRERKIRVLNLSCFGMNTSEVFLTLIKAVLKLEPDIVIIPTTPRDFANEEVKTMGIAPEYSPPILEPLVLDKLSRHHFAFLKTDNRNLIPESLAQFSRVWQREFNQITNQSLAKIWPTYMARTILSEKVKQFLFFETRTASALAKIEATAIKSPSLERPLYSQEIFPNTRSFQFKVLLNFLSQNLPTSVLVYNQPLRPKTIDLYFTSNDYQKKVVFIKENSQKYGFDFIDFNNLLTDDHFDDWIHLNPKGVNKMAVSLSDWLYQKSK